MQFAFWGCSVFSFNYIKVLNRIPNVHEQLFSLHRVRISDKGCNTISLDTPQALGNIELLSLFCMTQREPLDSSLGTFNKRPLVMERMGQCCPEGYVPMDGFYIHSGLHLKIENTLNTAFAKSHKKYLERAGKYFHPPDQVFEFNELISNSVVINVNARNLVWFAHKGSWEKLRRYRTEMGNSVAASESCKIANSILKSIAPDCLLTYQMNVNLR